MRSFLIFAITQILAQAALASEGLPVYKRVVDAPSLGLLRTELAVSDYECSSPKPFRLTLYPMIHAGEPEFYAEAQKRLNLYDAVFFESARPPGFYSRLFDRVGPHPASSERDLALLRLSSLRFFLEEYQKKNGRPAATIAEALGRERAYLKSYLIDAKGEPLVIENHAKTGLEVCLKGTPRICSRDLPPADPVTGLMDGFREAYRDFAKAHGLVAQHDVMSSDFPNFHNADIGYDLIFSSDDSWWELRNSYAVRVMAQHVGNSSAARVAIQYGVGHFREFHQLLAAENGCRLISQEWQPIYRADDGLNVPAAELAKRREKIKKDREEE